MLRNQSSGGQLRELRGRCLGKRPAELQDAAHNIRRYAGAGPTIAAYSAASAGVRLQNKRKPARRSDSSDLIRSVIDLATERLT